MGVPKYWTLLFLCLKFEHSHFCVHGKEKKKAL